MTPVDPEPDDATVRQSLDELMMKWTQADQRKKELQNSANGLRRNTEEVIAKTLTPGIADVLADMEALEQAMLALAQPSDRFSRLAEEGLKTIKLNNGEISRRLKPISLVIKDAKATIKRMRRARLLRKYARIKRTVEINVNPFKQALQADPKLAAKFPEVELVQEETFIFRGGKSQAEITVSVAPTPTDQPKEA